MACEKAPSTLQHTQLFSARGNAYVRCPPKRLAERGMREGACAHRPGDLGRDQVGDLVRALNERRRSYPHRTNDHTRPPSLAGSNRGAALLAIHGAAPRPRRAQGLSANHLAMGFGAISAPGLRYHSPPILPRTTTHGTRPDRLEDRRTEGTLRRPQGVSLTMTRSGSASPRSSARWKIRMSGPIRSGPSRWARNGPGCSPR